ncbi:MAG: quinoprotein dehydrogenase-associated SoxYZ-like carrier [Paracoccus sp. (in: a-proteobacteria)]|uniref:quinoprotein dehydrogenase-associated SoxYZ-like carrier n=1 Tax=Paracoccus sp. TaxID=267 RepID=UPI0026E07416|nr:quinoprotein dehydrogenase-associated SoxYZ-like carrier [Paracoccus sp. (in: a-proteobacteria)]MDO5632976.1 quinoprotein dehydrogenase-associated SoxYZ-like carrier [Paracoccus sp. (in: a-proteobacteria)]
MNHLLIAAAVLLAAPALAQDNPLRASATWDDIRESVVGLAAEPPINPAVIDLDAPFRAHEAAIVPVRLTQPSDAPPITALALIVDENPAPVAAEYTFGPALMPLDFEVRLRVDSYSDVRAIADTPDGPVMAGRFVRASGGCSAPAGKDMAAVRATMGQMRWRSTPDGDRAIGTLMIRHPNFSGLQRDQVTLLTIPAHFIQTLEVKQGDAPLFTMEAGISVSEDPVFRFAYRPDGQPIHVHVADTNGNVWEETFATN